MVTAACWFGYCSPDETVTPCASRRCLHSYKECRGLGDPTWFYGVEVRGRFESKCEVASNQSAALTVAPFSDGTVSTGRQDLASFESGTFPEERSAKGMGRTNRARATGVALRSRPTRRPDVASSKVALINHPLARVHGRTGRCRNGDHVV
jgi:hypothetical protein